MFSIENDLSLTMLLEMPNKILDNSKNEKNRFINLLSEDVCNIYYYTELKSDLRKYFDDFNDFKYLFSNNYKTTSNYCLKEEKFTNYFKDKISNFVEKQINHEKYILKTYNQIMEFSSKITYQEAIYFVEAFFARKSDEYISEELGISRNGLQRIRKSCLVKMYLEFLVKEGVNL